MALRSIGTEATVLSPSSFSGDQKIVKATLSFQEHPLRQRSQGQPRGHLEADQRGEDRVGRGRLEVGLEGGQGETSTLTQP